MVDFYQGKFHEINPFTMAIIGSNDRDGKPISYILEEKEEYTSYYRSTKLIDEACKFFGGSLKNQQENTKTLSGFTHKVPISIEPTSGMFFFPTLSPSNPSCSWVNHSHIKEIKELEKRKTKVIFKNGTSVNFPISYGSMRNQLERTAQYRYLLEDRLSYVKDFRSPYARQLL